MVFMFIMIVKKVAILLFAQDTENFKVTLRVTREAARDKICRRCRKLHMIFQVCHRYLVLLLSDNKDRMWRNILQSLIGEYSPITTI